MGSKLFGARTKTGGDHSLSVQTRCAGIASDLLTWNRAIYRYPPGYYVYKLIDPRDQRVFYVGKGQRDRAWQHERSVAAGHVGSNKDKEDCIRAILDAGCRVTVKIDAIYRLESDALEREFQLVDVTIGLTNRMVGGVGPAATPDLINRRQLMREQKLAEVRAREAQAARVRKIERVTSSLRGADSPEVVAWVEEMKTSSVRLRYTPQRSGKQSKADLAAFRASKPGM